MATAQGSRPTYIGSQMYAEYRCPRRHIWKDYDSHGRPKTCRKCTSKTRYTIHYQDGRRYATCHMQHTWELDDDDSNELCKECHLKVKPHVYRKLKFTDLPDKALFGRFKCSNCKQEWASANAWKDYKQQCKSCFRYTWPFFLKPKEFSGERDDDLDKPHRRDLCEKCQELGHSCC